jgi:Trp operon repressor
MLKKDKAILEMLTKKYGKKHLIKEANDADVLKAVAQDQVNANNNKDTKWTTEQRRKALVDVFKKRNYHDYIGMLNQMAQDDKFRVLVDAAFGGDGNEALGNISLNESKETKRTKTLIPTQSEIDITKSLAWGLRGGEGSEPNAQVAIANIDRIFGGDAVKLGKGEGLPIVTFGSFIIDGHHRWSQVYCFNPSAKMAAVDFDGDLSPLEMLKATQGCIAAIKKDKLPQAIVEGSNMFKASEKEIRSYIDKNILDEVVERIKKYKNDLKDKNDVVNYITSNCMSMKENNAPMTGSGGEQAPNRGDMPQTDMVDGKELTNKLEKGVVAIPGKK